MAESAFKKTQKECLSNVHHPNQTPSTQISFKLKQQPRSRKDLCELQVPLSDAKFKSLTHHIRRVARSCSPSSIAFCANKVYKKRNASILPPKRIKTCRSHKIMKKSKKAQISNKIRIKTKISENSP